MTFFTPRAKAPPPVQPKAEPAKPVDKPAVKEAEKKPLQTFTATDKLDPAYVWKGTIDGVELGRICTCGKPFALHNANKRMCPPEFKQKMEY